MFDTIKKPISQEINSYKVKILNFYMQLKIKNFIPIIFLMILLSWIMLVQLNVNKDDIVSQIYILLVETTRENFTSAIIIYSVVYFVCVSLSVPVASYLTLIGGAIFNWIALPLVVLSATLGAIVIFLLSRGILADYFSKKIKGNYENLTIGFRKNNFFYILFLRLVPFAPFFVINILAGIMNMRTVPYAFATLIGILPGTSVYVWTGITFGELLVISEISSFGLASSRYFLPILILSVISLSPIFFKKIYNYYINPPR